MENVLARGSILPGSRRGRIHREAKVSRLSAHSQDIPFMGIPGGNRGRR